MIYVVTGHPRSGTSMMMQALEAGGIPAAFNDKRDARLALLGDHQLSGFNPNGSYELTWDDLYWNFPEAFDGMAVKLVWDHLRFLKGFEGGYSVISMVRDPEEVRQSYEATVSQRRTTITRFYPNRLNSVLNFLATHPSVRRVNGVNYRFCVEDPLQTFITLAEQEYPIDPVAAASVVDPDLYRFRRELLIDGA